MVFVIYNGIAIFFLILTYFFINNYLSKSLFFDVTVLSYFVLFISPLILTGINLLFIIFIAKKVWYLSLVPLLIPFFSFVIHYLKIKNNAKTFINIKQEISPIIISILNSKNVKVGKNDISMVYYKSDNEKHIDIYISSQNVDNSTEGIINKLENYLRDLHSEYITRVFLEKKRTYKMI